MMGARSIASLTVLATWALANSCMARVPISIPALPLAQALQELSRQTGTDILFLPGNVANLRSSPVHQGTTAEEAIGIMLAKTPLEAVRDSNGGLILRPRIKAVVTPRPAPSRVPALISQSHAVMAPSGPLAQPAHQDVDIVVKAMRINDGALQSMPLAIASLSSDDLVRSGANTLAALAPLAPSLQVAPVRTTALTFIRGVGTTLTSPNVDPAISTNINGVYVPLEMTASVFFDLTRIDILPGPQGTLYGRNAVGGVIDLVTRRPGDRLAGDGFAELGNYGRLQAQAGLDTPLTDRLFLRTSLSLIRHAGYDSNGGDDQDSKAGRLTLVWKPDPATSVTGIGTYSRDQGIGPFNFNVPATYGSYRNEDFDPRQLGFFIDYRTLTSSIEVDHALGTWGHLIYIGGYDHLHQQTRTAAWSSTPPAILNAAQANDTASQDVRLNANWKRFDLKAGVYGFGSSALYTSATDNQGIPVSTTNSIGPLRAKSHGWTAFGQATYAAMPWLRLTAGLRYSRTVKSLTGVDIVTIADTAASTSTILPYEGRVALGHVDWLSGAEADVLAHSLLYGRISTGVTPGGLSAIPAMPGQPAALSFKPAYLTAYTLGLKNRLFDGRMSLNVEGFWYNYHNYQVSQRDLSTYENTVYTADKAQAYGIQIDGHYTPSRSDTFTLSLALQRARAVSLTTPVGVFDGFQLPFAPNGIVRASWRHVFDLAKGAKLEAFVNGDHTSSRWGTYTHAPGTFVGATSSVNATLTYHVAGGHMSLALWVRNLTDAIIPTQVSAAPSPAGPGQEFLSPPRTYGLRFAFNF